MEQDINFVDIVLSLYTRTDLLLLLFSHSKL